ncbi:conserved hypothetical protein [Leptospira interrogans serovar Manilae]|uniref:Uncharacterized protein n=1 Tax=Leptospira interrogans serovar Manilae TaxID=214675 RepID=A0AAQ1NWH2_LEPIR|nr:hypothetical protein LEP1GSC013_4665 [Leptospira interrogans serovar Valbuzzi str. Duyster]ENO73821.1 hypothetical protein LEP1GSC012_1788 [Leptospira interrogans serovar Valbuzzi str. Valbuzzi]SOR60702.1 conserved hypothetical protein [Leptospira interrogans serovar Manilae]
MVFKDYSKILIEPIHKLQQFSQITYLELTDFLNSFLVQFL